MAGLVALMRPVVGAELVDPQRLAEEARKLDFQRSEEEAGLAGSVMVVESFDSPNSTVPAWMGVLLNACSMPGPKTATIICLNVPRKALWCLLKTWSAESRNACRHSSLSCWVVVSLSPGNNTRGISFFRYGMPLLFFLKDSRHFCWNWSTAS
jgi:hypothetical protein